MKLNHLSIFIGLIGFLTISEGLRLWWYRRDLGNDSSAFKLVWRPPSRFTDINLAESRASEMLSYDFGQQLRLDASEQGLTTEVTYLEYNAKNPRVLPDLYIHSPEICLPASGTELVRELNPKELTIAGTSLYIRRWLFTAPQTRTPIFAFKTVWSDDDQFLRDTLYSRDLREARLSAAWTGREFSASRMILAITFGTADENIAWEEFQTRILSHLTTEDAQGRD